MDVWFHQTLISGIGEFQPIYIYRTVRGCFSLSTYFGIPDILVLEKYIGCPLRPKKVPNRILLQVRGDTGNDVISSSGRESPPFYKRVITISQYKDYKWILTSGN